jgi:hypothetical protein
MTTNAKKVLGVASSALLFAIPALAMAATNPVGQGLGMFSGLFGNGLAAERTLPQLIVDVVQLMLIFAGAVAVIFVIIGGYLYITAGGNEEQSEKGKKSLINAIIGIVIIIMSYAIINVVQNTITSP